MERLTGLDATFLYVETASLHMHVAMVAVFDTSTVPGGYSFEKVRALVEARLPRIPLFRRRLVEVPFRLHHPVWVEDPDFDLDYHLRRVAVPAPGGLRELTELAGDFCSRQLDRSRPLWELAIVEGLEDGNIGVLAKVHHCTIDGVSGAEMMVHLFDLTAEPAEAPVSEEVPRRKERVPSDAELVGYAVNSLVRQPMRMARTIPRTGQAVVNLVRRRRQPDTVGMATPFTAPRTSFNGAITPRRKIAVGHMSLDEVKSVKRAFGVTVNDVVLAVCAGALRRYLDRRQELPDTPLIAVVPISVRSGGDGANREGANREGANREGANREGANREGANREGANKVSAMFTTLATDIDDPIERLRAISEVTRGAKEEHQAIGAEMLQDWAEFAAPAVFSRAANLYTRMKLADRHRPIHNLVISNVPGPPFPLYFAGAKLVLLCPLGPVMEGSGLNITVLSYLDSMDVGIIACRELVPDVWDLADDFGEALEELKKAAAAETGSKGRPTPKRPRAKSPRAPRAQSSA